jgi:hypothetical protein
VHLDIVLKRQAASISLVSGRKLLLFETARIAEWL